MRRKGEKIALGFFACLPILCLLTAVVLYVTGWGDRLWNTVVLAGRGQSMVNLSRRTPFVPPQGAGVSEERLEAYLEVCSRVKPAGDEVDDWEDAHRPREGQRGPRSKWEAAGLVQLYMKELGAAMEAQGMGPDEFCWIHERMRAAAGAKSSTLDPDPAGQETPARPEDRSDAALYARFAGRIEACALREHSVRIVCGFAARPPAAR